MPECSANTTSHLFVQRQTMPSTPSQRLDDLRWRDLQLSAKYTIPESACDAEAVLVVGKVVLEMVFLELLVVAW